MLASYSSFFVTFLVVVGSVVISVFLTLFFLLFSFPSCVFSFSPFVCELHCLLSLFFRHHNTSVYPSLCTSARCILHGIDVVFRRSCSTGTCDCLLQGLPATPFFVGLQGLAMTPLLLSQCHLRWHSLNARNHCNSSLVTCG